MPIVEQDVTPNRAWGLWKIEEPEDWLHHEVEESTSVPSTITHPNKRLEYLAARVLVKQLVSQMGLIFHGISKNDYGKPSLINHPFNISLSHSYPYVTALIDRVNPVGIDLEQPKEKLLSVAPRMFQQDELLDAGESITKHCIYWCAKETLLKVYGKKDLTFAKDLIITPFSLQKSGLLIGRIIDTNHETRLTLYYAVRTDFVIVYTL
jgi:4'-phosphopantetheinyl transferase